MMKTKAVLFGCELVLSVRPVVRAQGVRALQTSSCPDHSALRVSTSVDS